MSKYAPIPMDWAVKVLCGLLLIALVAERFLVGWLPVYGGLAFWPGQLLVVTGGVVVLSHYILLKRGNASVSTPTTLVTRLGLYRWVRHPMYLGDVLVAVGLTLLAPGPVSGVVLLVLVVSIWRQARIEDARNAACFGTAYDEWCRRTGRLLPGL